ncbi:MAG: flagellar export chaperone FlgN [Syntrophomonadaceae bacterium]
MINTLVDSIIDIFKEQYQLYRIMADYAGEQQELLKKPFQERDYSQVMNVIIRRQGLLKDLNLLDNKNKNLQKRLTEELGINEFNLCQLKAKIANEQYTIIAEIVNQIGTILNSITNTDYQSQLLMQDRLDKANKTKTIISRKQANSIYQEVFRIFQEEHNQ